MNFLKDEMNLVQILKLTLMSVVFAFGLVKVLEIINLLKIIANK